MPRAVEMAARMSSDEQDWRLQAELDVGDTRRALHGLIGRLRGGPDIVREVEATLPHDVVITHDGRLLFAYAADEAALTAARSAIEEVLGRDGIQASVRISHWDDERDGWRQPIRRQPPRRSSSRMPPSGRRRDRDAHDGRQLGQARASRIRAEHARVG